MAGETLPSGSTNTQGLADWAAPYITNYLGKAQALSETPYQVYQGPLTAGASNLQNKVFQGLAGLTFPSNLGQSFASPMGGNTNNFGGPGGPAVMPQQGMSMPNYGMGAPQAPKTEDDWNKFSSMAFFAPGTDMAKAKADFLAGGRGGDSDKNNPLFAGVGAMPSMGDYASGATAPPPGAAPGTPEFMSWLQSQKGTGVTQNTPLGAMPQSGIAGLQPPQASMQPSNIAQTYMNPYLQSVLNPQLDELRRQNDITNMATNAKMTQAGAFGGGRQAIMNAENNRNLMMEQNKTVGQGYASAYDKAMQQFNTEQGQAKDLANLMSTQGGIERGITAEGVAADKEEFEKQRQYPFQQVQWQRDMISGLPTGSVTNTAGQMSGVGSFLNALGGGTAAASALGYKNVGELLKGLGLDLGP